MTWDVFQRLRVLHVTLVVLLAIGAFVFFARSRFWLPKYVHVLAIIGLGIGVWLATNVADDAPISRQGPIAKVLLALAPPAMIYFFFVFHGGQAAAFKRRNRIDVPCPYCKHPVTAFRDEQNAPDLSHLYEDQQCRHCGQTLA